MNKQKNNPSPQSEITADGGEAVQALSVEEAEKVVSLSTAKGRRRNAFEREDTPMTEAAQSKVQLVQTVRERIAEAEKLIAKGDAAETTVTEIAQDIALQLYNGRTAGLLSPDHVSSILGDGFGWKGKGAKVKQRVTAAEPDATRSKTPFGWGEAIRKRVVRAVNAVSFVSGDEQAAGAFFKGLDVDDVQPLLNELNAGTRSIWTVYDDLGRAKAERTGNRPKLHFDPKRIASITAGLGADLPHTVEMMQNVRGLFEAYTALYRMLGVVGNEIPADASKAA